MPSRAPRIEIVGVAGAGKSTLTRALQGRYAGCRVADSLHTRMPAHWPYVAHSVPRVLPLVARSVLDRPALSWDELKFVVYVSEWDRFLRARPEHRSAVTVLDQGPIFALARLLWGKKPLTRTRPFEAWLNRMVERWSVELDAIVWLVAPDEALLERINHREQRHEARGKPAPEGLELIELHREAYARLLELVTGLGRPRVLRFDTSTMRPAEIAGELVEFFEERQAQRLTEASTGLNVGQRRASAEKEI
jgi:adenylate kinase family enzyme